MRATVKGLWVAAAVGLMPGLSMAQPPERGGGAGGPGGTPANPAQVIERLKELDANKDG